MKQIIGSKRLRADLKLVASAILAGLIVGICLSGQLVTPVSASWKIEARAR